MRSNNLFVSTDNLRIRRGFLAALIASMLAGLGGFYLGQIAEKQNEEAHAAKTLEYFARGEDSLDLYLLHLAIEDLRSGRVIEGENKLLRYAQFKVPGVSRCRKSPECLFVAGHHNLSDAALSELAEMKER
jgi:hypothetical protein